MAEFRGQEFIDTYNQLIDWFKTKIDRFDHRTAPYPAGIEYVTRNKLLSPNKIRRLDDYRTLRNAIVHSTSPKGGKGGFIAEPTESAVKEFKSLVNELLNPPNLMNVAVKRPEIYSTTFDARAIDVMQEMNRKSYSHVPVLSDNKVLGVFSENTVFSFIATVDDVIHKDTRIEEFSAHLPIDKHLSEAFAFVSQRTPINEVCQIFSQARERGVRIGAVFITLSGQSDEPLQGMITAWDLAGADYI
jgi:predicted transcriptional regulator